MTAVDGDSLAVAQHSDVVGDHLVRVGVRVRVRIRVRVRLRLRLRLRV